MNFKKILSHKNMTFLLYFPIFFLCIKSYRVENEYPHKACHIHDPNRKNRKYRRHCRIKYCVYMTMGYYITHKLNPIISFTHTHTILYVLYDRIYFMYYIQYM